MGDLSAFLKGNALETENVKFAPSSRFVGQDGAPIAWEIRALSGAEDEEIRKGCIKPVPTGRGGSANETDVALYLGRLAAACTVYPDLNDSGLQDSYGVMGADNLLRKMLLPGEYAEFLRQVQKICGFDVPFDELVDQAKN